HAASRGTGAGSPGPTPSPYTTLFRSGAIARQRVESRQRWAHFGSKRTFLDPLVGWSSRHRPRSTCAAVPDGDDNDGGLIAVHGQPAGWVLDLASALLAGAVAGTVVGAIVGAVAVADSSRAPAS